MAQYKPFKVATFNANSLRARLHIIIPWLKENDADVLCIQETKVQDQNFPQKVFNENGYQVVFRGQKTYNGVAVASRHPIEAVRFGFGDGRDQPEDKARLIRCEVAGLPIVNTYVPQGRATDDPYFQYKIAWFERLAELFREHYEPDEPVLWCGDLNVAPEPRDVYAPERLENHVCFHVSVRKSLNDVISWGLIDLFRYFNNEDNQFTFFDYRIANSVKRRMGWRLDHIFVTRPLLNKAVNAYIDLQPRMLEKPSDHTFLVAEFRL